MKSKKAFDKTLMTVGLKLAYLREQKGFSTIKEFALIHELPEIQYWRIEKGKANITLKSLTRILNIHNITLHDFFCLTVAGQPII
jgi:transcriptional regulator with XRE-family HTH domain